MCSRRVSARRFYEPGPVLTSSPEYQATQDPTIELPKVPPHAVVTTHPLHGLVWITEIWRRLIYPQMNEARLAIYSSVLAKGIRGESVPDKIQPILERVKLATDANVVVVDPRGDRGMAEIYRANRIHFYPGHEQDYACWTLAESQAAGTPAVARAFGGVDERVINGQTGYLVPDAAAAANVALQILRDEAIYKSLSTAAGDAAAPPHLGNGRGGTGRHRRADASEEIGRLPMGVGPCISRP